MFLSQTSTVQKIGACSRGEESMYATYVLHALHLVFRIIISCNKKSIIDNFHYPLCTSNFLYFPFLIIVTSDIIKRMDIEKMPIGLTKKRHK